MISSHSFLALALFIAIFAVSAVSALMLTQAGDRRFAMALAVFGLAAACFKIYLLQQTPQWRDIPPDSITYQMHAEAMVKHWSGQPVEAVASRLAGILANGGPVHEGVWLPSSQQAYSSILGTHEWIYAAFLAVWKTITPDWKTWAMFSNAALAALFPAAAFGFARTLGATRPVGLMAAGFALVDPSAAVNASWLLKDTLACWAFILALWSGASLLRQQKPSSLVLFAFSMGLLGTVRFAALSSVLAAAAVMLPLLLVKRQPLAAMNLLFGALGGIYLFAFADALPSSDPIAVVNRPFASALGIWQGQGETISTSISISAAPLEQLDSTAEQLTKPGLDPTVLDWYSRLGDSPLTAIATAIARTLFAPYPWVVLTEGLDYHNGVELYYLGVVLWIACLPGLFWALITKSLQPSREFVFICLAIGVAVGAYLVFMGEWSTRQRVFMLPPIFALAAIGIDGMKVRLASLSKRDMSVGAEGNGLS